MKVGEFFGRLTGLSPRWKLAEGQRAQLALVVAHALTLGWTPGTRAEQFRANVSGVRNPAAVLAARLVPAELAPPLARPRRAPWCGQCDERTRMPWLRRRWVPPVPALQAAI